MEKTRKGTNIPVSVGLRGSAGKGKGRGYGGTLSDSPGFRKRYPKGGGMPVARVGGYKDGTPVQYRNKPNVAPKPGTPGNKLPFGGPLPKPKPVPKPMPKRGPIAKTRPVVKPKAR